MRWLTVILLGQVLWPAACKLQFPPSFKFGAASAAFQIEGAWNVSDKAPSIWDEMIHRHPETIADGSTGDVACDSYHLWRRDVEIAREMGLDFYRFSLSWPRILPNGFANKVSKDGINYYNNLINGLLEAGIEPMVTLYHWDLPQKLQDLGGWTNPLVADWFADYSRVVYSHFADRVKTWFTINEPLSACEASYGAGLHAPRIYSPEIGNYLCDKHMLLAHAKAWRVFDEEFRPMFQGRAGLVNHFCWYEADTPADEEYAELARQLLGGMYSHPIFSEKGGWPPAIEQLVAKKSKEEGYPWSRLPPFTDEEIILMKGTSDFYGVNLYTGRAVRRLRAGEAAGAWFLRGSAELGVALTVRPQWRPTGEKWLYNYPKSIRNQINWLRKEYGELEFFVTENGYPNDGRNLNDQDRIEYLRAYLEQVLLTIYEDGATVIGYAVWSLIDNMEWTSGYGPHFGLYAVDFSSPQRTRTPRASSYYYAAVVRARSLAVANVTNPYAGRARARSAAAPAHTHLWPTLLLILYLINVWKF